ncbi:unnamed protein product [Thlaspi arvense]|uniref:Uncharacterized protein n=1 Tax=Thlaspi arvense TaxID=13288 RepID=A0AAU9S2H8_THLAR|nr:unnamed protein product [Thlaspi arvense]
MSMAISHVQALLCLLASLFFLPTLYAYKFKYCNNNTGYDFGKVIGLATTPKDDDTTTTIYVFLNANKSLDKGSVIVNLIIGEGEQAWDAEMYELNEVVNALPIEPGIITNLSMTKVPLQSDLVRYDKVTVTLFDGDFKEILCITFNPNDYTASAAAVYA